MRKVFFVFFSALMSVCFALAFAKAAPSQLAPGCYVAGSDVFHDKVYLKTVNGHSVACKVLDNHQWAQCFSDLNVPYTISDQMENNGFHIDFHLKFNGTYYPQIGVLYITNNVTQYERVYTHSSRCPF